MLLQLSKRLSGSCPALTRVGIAAVAALALSSTALGQLFSNPDPINIPATGAEVTSAITVAGGPAVCSGDIVVTLTGFSAEFALCAYVVLESPSGQTLPLLSQSGGFTNVSGLNLVFSPGSPPLPDPLVSGSFSPAGGSLSNLAGSPGNGVWTLRCSDDCEFSGETISGGWSIFFGTGATAASPNQFTYQGRLTGGPASGTIDTRFTLWESDTSASTALRVAGPVTVSGLTLTNGLFSAPIDFGVPIPANRKTWLQIEVANPAGTAFVSLTPRQPMSYTPLVNVSSTAKGTHFGTTLAPGEAANDLSRVGEQVSFGTQAGCFPGEVNGMKVVVRPGEFCGISEEILFFTSQCNISCPREVMRINGQGNVGIGIDNPAQRLHVNGNILATGSITPSCAKLKENVAPISDALDKLASLDAVRFDWKADEAKVRGFTHDLGFIAEEVAKVFPEIVFRDDKGEIMGLDYSRMSAVAVGAIKQLKAENDQIKSDNAELKARLEKIEAMLAEQAAK